MSVCVDTDHLQQRQVAHPHVVEVNLCVLPADFSEVLLNQNQTLGFVVDFFVVKILLGRLIKTVIKLPCKQIDAHDAEDQPEDQTHEQHVKDGRDGSNERVHHHLTTEGERQVSALNPPPAHRQTGSCLTLMPSKRDRALRGLRALSVLRDLMAPSSEKPSRLAVRDTRDTCRQHTC